MKPVGELTLRTKSIHGKHTTIFSIPGDVSGDKFVWMHIDYESGIITLIPVPKEDVTEEKYGRGIRIFY